MPTVRFTLPWMSGLRVKESTAPERVLAVARLERNTAANGVALRFTAASDPLPSASATRWSSGVVA